MGGEEGRFFQRDDGMVFGNGGKLKVRKDKKRHKEDIMKDKNGSLSFPIKILEDKDLEKTEIVKEWKHSWKDNITRMKNGVEHTGKKKKKGRVRRLIISKGRRKLKLATKEVGEVKDNHDMDASETIGKNKRKKEKKKDRDDLGAGQQEMMVEELDNKSTGIEDTHSGYRKGNVHSTRNKAQDIEGKNGKKRNRKMPNIVETVFEDPNPKQKCKNATFSAHVEVFPSSDGRTKGKENKQEEALVQGKQFSWEEDEMIKNAIFYYIESYRLGKEGLNMVLHCKYYLEVKNCW